MLSANFMKKLQLAIVCMVTVLIHSCDLVEITNTTQVVSSCIPPLITFAFPINQSPHTPLPDQNIMPLSPWQMISELPAQENGSGRITNRIMLTHSVNGIPEIWVIRDLDKGQGDLRSSLLIYNTSTKQWHELSGVFDNISSAVNNIYEKQGTLWVVSRWADRVFGVFDESTQKFERLDIVEPIPEGYVYFDKRQGEFWIFEKFQAVYSLNPKTSTLVKRLETPNVDFFYNSVALAPDGSIYILDSLGNDSSSKNDLQILKFSPQNNELETIYNPLFDLTPFSSLFMDHSGRLWLDDHAWMNSDGVWYDVVRSPVFITDKSDAGPNYVWDFPKVVFESSDGRLWFRSMNGMVSLDPEKGEWCWFTTEQSNIIEDQDGNLWMIVENKLYTLDLEP